ncbi:hypothetical protein IVB18_31970 [Bradyrhizobium sp. 186]|uniref:hypothetical protein n=1 Tax=Bradyrhizobium sp. 186 TaxID=2782654 RepID=UPI0020013196|nr:hypothetical protein [Bradyrhizobium sp. 186]UPK32844.1 hypothetical protein IVB18_31970 [Bradyrhizobium sp. 186]
MAEQERIARALEQITAQVRKLPLSEDWVGAYTTGDAVNSDTAAFIADVSSATIRRRAAEAAACAKPLGILIAGSIWLISKRRLIDWIRDHEGEHAALCAMTRATKLAQMTEPLQASPRNERAAPEPPFQLCDGDIPSRHGTTEDDNG